MRRSFLGSSDKYFFEILLATRNNLRFILRAFCCTYVDDKNYIRIQTCDFFDYDGFVGEIRKFSIFRFDKLLFLYIQSSAAETLFARCFRSFVNEARKTLFVAQL